MGKEMDVELLISLVEARPVLWDRTSARYKDRKATKQAWAQVCNLLSADFTNFTADEKRRFDQDVMKRWVNIRDSYKKSLKKGMYTGDGAAPKYIHAQQLTFLSEDFGFGPRSADDNYYSTNEDSEPIPAENDHQSLAKRIKREEEEGEEEVEVDVRMRQKWEQAEDRHVSFFKGILPSLHTFTEQETIQFQAGLLQLITKIKAIPSLHPPT